MVLNLSKVIELIVKEKGLREEDLVQVVEAAVQSAAKKVYGDYDNIEAHYNPELDEVEVFQFKVISDEVDDPNVQISLKDARKLDPNCQIGDELGEKLDSSRLGRIAAQSAKQVIVQKVKEVERDAVYNEFIDRKGELVSGFVHRFDRRDAIVNLGKAEAILREKEMIPGEMFRRGDRIQALILDVTKSLRMPQIELSRTHPRFLVKLYEMEVPEVTEGIVEIVAVAREPGIRAKIAVRSHDPKVDPVGTCVGVKGARVQNVIQELKGERQDIVVWSEDPVRFVCNALSPARVSKVIVDKSAWSMDVVVADDQLSLAIGRKGQNVRLVAKLTGWKIDVRSEHAEESVSSEQGQALTSLNEIDESLAEALMEAGYRTIEDLAKAKEEDLLEFEGIDESLAKELIKKASVGVSG
ncbi:MAG: transcription termination/antitermination protein NusA [Bacteriovoracaceae bacterium]|jgi:N utilization substance protein A|nr:transcription termination/antitermination protein NusA [Bacteriovoracaceae bacterium]HNR51046.1 transcription termination factor NusA [Deltaproteobacteria bacterium]HOE72003.1 transcription termination factor NusA [Deltaproteobacteria bacterium]HPL86019.1 transcription termination factor NusA [Deltaproteobacteria bacterium]HPV28684.1 transcription termination factor NusA [Deltaproteobacteria bacterium]